MKQINDGELKIIVVIRKEPDSGRLELSAGAKYRVESDGLTEVRSVQVMPEGKTRDGLLDLASTILSLIKQKEGISEGE